MEAELSPDPAARGHRLAAAWLVHVLTASGVVWGLLAILAIDAGRLRSAFAWMALAMVIDGIDGTLARRADVARALPTIDGGLLDNLVDYLNYVLVPAYLLLRSGLLVEWVGLAATCAICAASLFQFARIDAKTVDGLFTGFPSYWNVVALYLVLLRPPAPLVLATVGILCLLVFVPVRYVYPSRTRTLRTLTIALTLAWAVSVVVLVIELHDPRPWLVWASLLYVPYYLGLSAVLTVRRDAMP
jgi:phosphatidylcholine synthase